MGCLDRENDTEGNGAVSPDRDPTAEPTTDLQVTEETLPALVEANTAFAFDLYGYLRENEEGNLLASPYSVSVALAMTYAGPAARPKHR